MRVEHSASSGCQAETEAGQAGGQQGEGEVGRDGRQAQAVGQHRPRAVPAQANIGLLGYTLHFNRNLVLR